MNETARQIKEFSAYIDASYGEGMDPELVMRRRTGKVGVEYGELLDAIEGWTGENPRKGVYASKEDVIKELLDVCGAALGSVEHLTGNQGESIGLLQERIAMVHARVG
jgi:NTP pyrophosphatase (non-canonical NTP hydrolase)